MKYPFSKWICAMEIVKFEKARTSKKKLFGIWLNVMVRPKNEESYKIFLNAVQRS
jgi:hypothetical protein